MLLMIVWIFFYSLAQPAGVPEILRKSLHSCSVKGGEEVFIIGKNFLKGTKVIFQENITGVVAFSFVSSIVARCHVCEWFSAYRPSQIFLNSQMIIPGKPKQRLIWIFSIRYMQVGMMVIPLSFSLNNLSCCIKPVFWHTLDTKMWSFFPESLDSDSPSVSQPVNHFSCFCGYFCDDQCR